MLETSTYLWIRRRSRELLGGVALASVAAMAAWAAPLSVQEMAPPDFEARPAPAEDSSATWRLTNRPHALEARFGTGGVLVVPHDGRVPGWSWGLSLIGAGPAGSASPVAPAEPTALGNRVEYRRPGLIEWYVNDHRGVEQGFTILEPPAGSATQLELLLAMSGSLSPSIGADADGLTLRDARGAAVLSYFGLHAFDATGRTVATRMELPAGDGGERLLRIAVDVADAVFPVVIDPLIATQVKKLTASDGDSQDRFGNSVSIDGDTAVVGAHQEQDGGPTNAPGAAYVFERHAGGTDNWGQVKKLTSPDPFPAFFFGYSVSISGNTIVVGTLRSLSPGEAYVFERDAGGAGNWGLVKKLTAADGLSGDRFGFAVSISGDRVVIGADQDDEGTATNAGSAYVFERNAGGAGIWGQVKKLTAADLAAGDNFGGAVSLSGDTIAVGAYSDDDAGTQSGSAYVFERNAGGAENWGQVKKLNAPDGAAFDFFAGSVSISGNTVVAGAGGDDIVGNDVGSAHVFERDAGGADNWGHVKKITAADGLGFDGFGSVSIDGDRILVGAGGDDPAGSAYVFERNAGGAANWGQAAKLTAADGSAGDQFGGAVSLSGDTVVIGDRWDMTETGSAYVFRLSSLAVCGDGLQETPEACDDGAGNSDVMPDACRTDCTLAGCGDDVADTGEDCDDAGESASCDADCTFAECGDGTWNVSLGEVCDDGNTIGGDDCAADCSVADTGVPGESGGGAMMASAVGSNIGVSFPPACSATDHAAYWGHGPIGPGGVEWSASACGLGTSGTASFDPGLLLPGEWIYFVVVGYDGNDEGGFGTDSMLVPRPEALAAGACDRPSGLSACP